MQEVLLELPGKSYGYSIYVGSGLLDRAQELVKPDNYSSTFVVTDENVAERWLPKLQNVIPEASTYVLPPGEKAKRIESVEKIWTAMRMAGCDRKSVVVILGGGVLGDLVGFAASTYMRGVAFVHIPTTLVAQADSSVGGKTGFDFDGLKNLVGSFAQPSAVIVDTGTLATLPERELIAGFSEMIKHGLIRDASYFNALSQKPPKNYTAAQLADFIAKSAHIKAAIIMNDEREVGERKVVNFGHTVGHAVEAQSWETDKPLLHGEAIAIGMVVETELSHRKGYISEADVQRVRQVLFSAGLPTTIPSLPIDKILEKIALDKKNERGRTLFTLLERIGQAVYNQIVEDDMLKRVLMENMEHTNAD